MSAPTAEGPTAEQIAAALSLSAEMEQMLGGLTPTQTSRALAHLQGKSASEIAAMEGVSRQAVAKTIASRPVGTTIRDLIEGVSISERKSNGDTEKRDLVKAALDTIATTMLTATRPFACGGVVTTVVDHELRFKAACRVLEWFEPPVEPAAPIAAPPPSVPVVEESVEVEQQTTRRRVRATRKGGA